LLRSLAFTYIHFRPRPSDRAGSCFVAAHTVSPTHARQTLGAVAAASRLAKVLLAPKRRVGAVLIGHIQPSSPTFVVGVIVVLLIHLVHSKDTAALSLPLTVPLPLLLLLIWADRG